MFAKFGWKTPTFLSQKSGKSDCQTRVRQTIVMTSHGATIIMNGGIPMTSFLCHFAPLYVGRHLLPGLRHKDSPTSLHVHIGRQNAI